MRDTPAMAPTSSMVGRGRCRVVTARGVYRAGREAPSAHSRSVAAAVPAGARIEVGAAPLRHPLRELSGRGLALDEVLERPQLEAALDQLLLAVVADDHDR